MKVTQKLIIEAVVVGLGLMVLWYVMNIVDQNIYREGSIVQMRTSPYGDYCHVDFASREHADVAVRELNNYQLNQQTGNRFFWGSVF